jgi:uncharacterized protein
MRLHSVLSPQCEVRESPLQGLGVYAKAEISRGDWVAIWGGKVYSHAEIEELADSYPHFASHPVSVFEGYALASTSLTRFDDAERFNHSCSPNVGVKGQIVVVARRRIRRGEELVFDYGTTESGFEPFECRCGSKRCRGTIDGTAWQDPAFQRRHRGWFSWYLAEAIRRQRK